jgi:CheY-like chemotaxis protein
MMPMTRVLVAEDDAFLSSLLVRALQAESFEAQAAYDGVQAIEKTKEWHPEIILLDLLMPQKDGFEVLSEIRADPATSETRIIILSNLGQTDDIERAKKLKVTDYMVKANTTPHEVATLIKKLLA